MLQGKGGMALMARPFKSTFFCGFPYKAFLKILILGDILWLQSLKRG